MARVRSFPGKEPKKEKAKEKKKKKSEPTEEVQACSSQQQEHMRHEIKHLQDSLSTFFTPTTGRRCRIQKKMEEGGSTDEMETNKEGRKDPERKKPDVTKPLHVDVSTTEVRLSPRGSLSSSNRSTDISPSRRACEKLVDSLSPYFSATSGKRRAVQKGEFAVLNGTRTYNYHNRDNSPESTQDIKEESTEQWEATTQMSIHRTRRATETIEIQPIVGGRGTLNSASAALFGSPTKGGAEKVNNTSTTNEAASTGSRTRVKTNSESSNRRRANDSGSDKNNVESRSNTNDKMKIRKKKRNELSSPVGSVGSASGEKENVKVDVQMEDGKIRVSEHAREMFAAAQRKTQKEIDDAIAKVTRTVTGAESTKEPRWPLAIRVGDFEIKTWFSAPYPQEYAHVSLLYICQYCLKYMKSEAILKHHKEKCKSICPPGNEIYRCGNISVFEVDGIISKIYCQNLCLMAKLFLDHKTLYYDVEPFLFYVVTTNDEYGFNFVGYFSKEKYSNQRFNLSCIVTLPCYQKQGFGRFLIDFSYLLSRKEATAGSPERPLSDLGRVSYASYWRTAIFEWIHEQLKNAGKISIDAMAKATGIALSDIVETLDGLQWLQKSPTGSVRLELNWSMIDSHWKKAKSDKSRIWLNESCLKWIPVSHTPSKDFGVRSPVALTPHRSPKSTAHVGSTPTGVSIQAVGSTVKRGCCPKSSKKTAARKLKLGLTVLKPDIKESSPEPSSGHSSSQSDEEDVKPSRKGCSVGVRSGRRGRKDSSPDDEPTSTAKAQKAPIKKGPSDSKKEANSTSLKLTSSGREYKSRGKTAYDDDLTSSSSANESSSDDDEYMGTGQKPQKGSKGKAVPVRRRKPAAKPKGKVVDKVLPRDCREDQLPSSSAQPILRPVSPANSVASNDTTPMIAEEDLKPVSPGGGRSLKDVEVQEEVQTTSLIITQSPACVESGRSSRLQMDTKATISSEEAVRSDDSRPHSAFHSTPPSPQYRSPPRYMDKFPGQVNMGGIPDDDDSRCAPSEESDAPPQLQAERVEDGGGSSDEQPPQLAGCSQESAPLLMTEGYQTDDDEAPPQLSPAIRDAVEEEEPKKEKHVVEMTEDERRQMELDRPPKAPVMVNKMDEDELAYQQSLEAASSHQSIQQQTQPTTPVIQQTHSHQMQTPYHPGSIKQTTPGSAPSCQMQTTPEMAQAQFMSPVQGPMQPSSVNSVQNSSLEMAPPGSTGAASYPPMSVPPTLSTEHPPTPMRSQPVPSTSATFSSPPSAAVQNIRTSTDGSNSAGPSCPVATVPMVPMPAMASTSTSVGVTGPPVAAAGTSRKSSEKRARQAHNQQQQHAAAAHQMAFQHPNYGMPTMLNAYGQPTYHPSATYSHYGLEGTFQTNPYWGMQQPQAAAMGTMMPNAAMFYPGYPGMPPAAGAGTTAWPPRAYPTTQASAAAVAQFQPPVAAQNNVQFPPSAYYPYPQFYPNYNSR